MSKAERPPDNPGQGWQQADARILGQILAVQNVVFTLPDTIRIAEFYAQILISIPGITACRVCLGGESVQSGKMPSDVCAECETLRHSAWDNGKLISTNSGFKCELADQPGMRAIAIDSHQHHFGFFVFQMDEAALSALYQPFINNLSNYVALILENRRQNGLLQKANEELINLNQDLHKRAAALEATNKELDAFAYSVSHDLRAPLRHIDGFMELLKKKVGTALDEQSRHYMDTISDAARKMGQLIDDLLSFSRMGRHAMSFRPVVLGSLVRDVVRELAPDAAGRTIDWRIGDLPEVTGDAAMLRIVLSNLIANALKFTRSRQEARVEIGSLPGQTAEAVIFVRDNGVGFDMTYGNKLFGVFQRLHRADEFEGTGIGLANVRRIVTRHGGRTWAEGKPEQGATFYFALPQT